MEDRIPDDMEFDQEGQMIHPGTRSKNITSVKSTDSDDGTCYPAIQVCVYAMIRNMQKTQNCAERRPENRLVPNGDGPKGRTFLWLNIYLWKMIEFL